MQVNPVTQPKVIVRERIGSIPYRNIANWEEGIKNIAILCGIIHSTSLPSTNNPLGVSPSKGNQGTTRGKEKIF